MTKLLLVNHDGGTNAYEVETDQDIKECLAQSQFGAPLETLSPNYRLELEQSFEELAEAWEIDGEQWSVELREGCVMDWRKRQAEASAEKEPK